jgi:hypothetical protein
MSNFSSLAFVGNEYALRVDNFHSDSAHLILGGSLTGTVQFLSSTALGNILLGLIVPFKIKKMAPRNTDRKQLDQEFRFSLGRRMLWLVQKSLCLGGVHCSPCDI